MLTLLSSKWYKMTMTSEKYLLKKLSSDRVKRISQALIKMHTPIMKLKAKRTVESIIHLRRLHDIHEPAYNAAFHAWADDFLDICHMLDQSGVFADIKDCVTNEFQDFSFEDNGPMIAKLLKIDHLIHEWKVPLKKYQCFWPYIDENVKKVFTKTDLNNHFEIEPIANRVFGMINQTDAFAEWEHLDWNWKVFFSCSAIGLGGMTSATGIGVAGVVAGAAGLAAQ